LSLNMVKNPNFDLWARVRLLWRAKEGAKEGNVNQILLMQLRQCPRAWQAYSNILQDVCNRLTSPTVLGLYPDIRSCWPSCGWIVLHVASTCLAVVSSCTVASKEHVNAETVHSLPGWPVPVKLETVAKAALA
jgi:hypothetical protein